MKWNLLDYLIGIVKQMEFEMENKSLGLKKALNENSSKIIF